MREYDLSHEDACVYLLIQMGWDDHITGDVSDEDLLYDKWYLMGQRVAKEADVFYPMNQWDKGTHCKTFTYILG